MKTIIIFSTIALLFLNSQSCNTIEPPQDNNQPGRRDYTWTADTLKSDDWFGVTDAWGSSPTNIWLTASGTTGWDCLWHYNGEKWERYNEYVNTTLWTVFGKSPNEVWIGDGESNIWRYDGIAWKKFQKLTLSGFDHIVIESIYGTSQNNLFAVGTADNYDGSGYKGVILRYDGISWKFLNIPNLKVGFHKIKEMSKNKYLVEGSNDDNGFLEKLFVFDGLSSLKEIYSNYNHPGLYEMNGDAFITINRKIYKCNNNELILWKEFPGTAYYGTVLGRNEKDFFCAGYEGIMHYNGTDLQTLYPAQLNLWGFLIFEKEVFFDGYDSEKKIEIIIRGTLKEE